MDEARYQLWKLNLLATLQQQVRTVCSCDFLYWITDLMPAFFSDIFDNPSQVFYILKINPFFVFLFVVFCCCSLSILSSKK